MFVEHVKVVEVVMDAHNNVDIDLQLLKMMQMKQLQQYKHLD